MTPLHDALLDDHRRLDRIFSEVGEATAAGADLRTIGEIWTRFGAALRRHLALEEDAIFPVLTRTHPDEISALCVEHHRIRTRLERLDMDVDLHLLRDPAVRSLIADLQAHARREDVGLYAWAEAELSPAEKRHMLTELDRQGLGEPGAAAHPQA